MRYGNARKPGGHLPTALRALPRQGHQLSAREEVNQGSHLNPLGSALSSSPLPTCRNRGKSRHRCPLSGASSLPSIVGIQAVGCASSHTGRCGIRGEARDMTAQARPYSGPPLHSGIETICQLWHEDINAADLRPTSGRAIPSFSFASLPFQERRNAENCFVLA